MCRAIAKKFLLADSPDSVIPSLKEMVEFIEMNLQASPGAEVVKFKIKIILAELLNNALKHVKNAESTIDISIDNHNIAIKKTDYGNRFTLKSLEVFISGPSNKVQISSDALHSVYAMVEDEFNLTFICKEKTNSGLTDYDNLIEHFGLLIISKSADKFTYNYNPNTGLNTFKIKVLLHNSQ